MRRRLAVLLIAPALVLTACGGGDSKTESSASPSASRAAVPTPVASASPMPGITGDAGKKTTITIPKGEPSGDFVVRTVTKGNGAEVKKDDLVLVNFTGKIWKSGKDIKSSYDEDNAPQAVKAGSSTVIPAFSQAVVGQKVGSQVLVVAPPEAAFGSQGSTDLGVSGTDTLVLALDIGRIVPKTAKGKQVSIPDDLPQVTADKEEAATIAVPKTDPPTKLVDKVLIEGDGAVVKSGHPVYLQYSGATWKENEGKAKAKLFDSSWNTGAPYTARIGTGSVIKGWDEGLGGKKVGSRVLLVIPPDKGYGDSGQGSIPGGATLVFVVDILAAL